LYIIYITHVNIIIFDTLFTNNFKIYWRKQNILLLINKNINIDASAIKFISLNFWYYKFYTISCYTFFKKWLLPSPYLVKKQLLKILTDYHFKILCFNIQWGLSPFKQKILTLFVCLLAININIFKSFKNNERNPPLFKRSLPY